MQIKKQEISGLMRLKKIVLKYKAINHILKQYLLLKNSKIDPRKPLHDALDLIQNALYYDKEFHHLHYKIIEFSFVVMKIIIIILILDNK
jgi:hypothetical protein